MKHAVPSNFCQSYIQLGSQAHTHFESLRNYYLPKEFCLHFAETGNEIEYGKLGNDWRNQVIRKESVFVWFHIFRVKFNRKHFFSVEKFAVCQIVLRAHSKSLLLNRNDNIHLGLFFGKTFCSSFKSNYATTYLWPLPHIQRGFWLAKQFSKCLKCSKYFVFECVENFWNI